MKKLLSHSIFKKAAAVILSLCMLVYLIPDINFEVHAENLTNDNIPGTCGINEEIPLLANDIFIEQAASMFDPNNGNCYGISSITANVGSAGNAAIIISNDTFAYDTYWSYISGNDYGIAFKANQPGTYKFTATLMDGSTGSEASIHEITITVTSSSTYTVSFNSNGGTAVANLTNVASGSKITAPTAPTKTGYKFSGWYKAIPNAPGAAKWGFDTDTVTADTTLYACWAPTLKSVAGLTDSSPAGGTGIDMNTESDYITWSITVPNGTSSISLSDIVSETGGYVDVSLDLFQNYVSEDISLTAGIGKKIYVQVSDNNGYTALNYVVTVTREAAPTTYTVTFDSQSATTEASPTTKTVTSPATNIDALPTAPTKNGYNFGGWYTEINGGGTEFTATIAVTGNITVYAKWTANDTTAPTVSSVSVPSNGTYKTDDMLSFTVNFSEAVNVTGTPRILLTIGSTGRFASYASGTGTSALVFSYTVQSGDNDSDGIAVGTAISLLLGGTIKDTANNDAVLTLNSVGSTTGVKVDTTAPTVSSVAVPADKTYKTGEALNFTVNFSEAVNVTGTPLIPITIGSAGKFASYVSGTGTSALVFRYTVVGGDNDSDGIAIGTAINTLVVNTIKDAANNDAVLTLNSIAPTSGILIDAVAPDAPSAPDLDSGSDTGLSNTDNITNDTTPTFTGTAEANATVKLYDGATKIGETTADGSGNWTITSSTLSQGTHSITATATDAVGNESAASTALSITIATTPGVPQNLMVTPESGQAEVTFAPPTDNGGSAITGYTITIIRVSDNYTKTVSNITSPYTASSLINGEQYNFSVAAVNIAGPGAYSSEITARIGRTGKAIVSTTIGDLSGGNVINVPYGTTVSAFKAGLTVSDGASAEILASSGGTAVANQNTTAVTSSMKVKVTAENGTSAEYSITVEAATYTVSFNSNGGTAIDDLTNVTSGSKITAPTAPTKDGFIFGGWYKDAGLTDDWDFVADTVTSSITLYAKWTAVPKYTVSFNSNGGTVISDLADVISGSKINAPTAPKKSNYTFKGWYKESSLTNVWNFATDTVTSNITLYAKWSANTPTPTPDPTPTTTESPVTTAAPADKPTITVKETPQDIPSPDLITVTPVGDPFDKSVEVRLKDDPKVKEEVQKALESSDTKLPENAKVFPLDISMYVTGTDTKVQPKDGTAVEITCPVPQELLSDKDDLFVVCVVDGKLHILPVKIVMKNGVPCAVFTATHFSPYAFVIDKDGKLATLAAGEPTLENTSPLSQHNGIPYIVLSLGLIAGIIIFKRRKAK